MSNYLYIHKKPYDLNMIREATKMKIMTKKNLKILISMANISPTRTSRIGLDSLLFCCRKIPLTKEATEFMYYEFRRLELQVYDDDETKKMMK